MSDAPKPSATAVLIRDAGDDLEVLLLERNASGEGGRSGPSVFPGGKIDAVARRGHDDVESWARRAAVREVAEEAGLRIAPEALIPISRWITPEISPRRFDTWFFVAPVDPGQQVRVDGSEICRHRWLPPGRALEAYRRREIRLAPPTFVTVHWLTAYARVSQALESLERQEVLTFRPRICETPEGHTILYPGDAGYESGEPGRAGPRHRLWVRPDGWHYERGEA